MKKLIVNADDFGLHEAVNRAIIDGHRRGCITSASLMAGGSAFAEAAAAARQTPTLGVGVHLTLVAERPVLPLRRVPTLVGGDGRFLPAYGVFMARYARGSISLAQIEAEFAAQIEKVLAAGVRVTHLDSHQHLHVLPEVTKLCIRLAGRYGVKAVRVPAEPYLFTGGYRAAAARWVGRAGLTFLAERARRRYARSGIAAPAHFFGMLAGGSMTAPYLERIVENLPEGISEVMMHPGSDAATLGRLYPWGYKWEEERAAALHPPLLERIRQENITLCSFEELWHE